MITVTESGMTFGPFAEDNVFCVEKSPFVMRLNGIKSCEFALWLDEQNKLVFIEAKSSVPSARRSDKEYEQYFTDMLEKFDNSLQLLLAATHGQQAELAQELSVKIAGLNWQRAKIQFYLVIPTVPKENAQHLTEKLKQTLSRQLKIWKAHAFVINEQMARSKGLLASSPP